MDRYNPDVAALQACSATDPFSFLVVEQIIKEKARQRIPAVKPSRMFFSHERTAYENALRSYQSVENICNQFWESLVFRLMQTQVEDTLLPFEKALQRRIRAEQHQDDLQELVYKEELRLKSEQLRGNISPEDYQRQLLLVYQMQFPELYSQTLHQLETQRQSNLALLEHQRAYFEQITKAEANLHHKYAKRMMELEHSFQLQLVKATPDKSDPAYIAGRRREAYKVYSAMVDDVMGNPNLSNEEKRRDVKLIFEMAAK